ncbi:MAG: OmpA family protein [Phycisphaeraceae bacterium]|nr:OmpA family protein [Phycisphaeraceae bacterium]
MQRNSFRLAIALVAMLLVSAGCQSPDLRERNADLMAENTELREQHARTLAALDAAEADREALIAELNRLQAAGPAARTRTASNAFSGIEGVEVDTGTAGSITVRVPGDVLFAPGKVSLKAGSKKTLGEVAAVLKREYGNNTVRVEGYTDTDPIRKSKWKDNLELSLQRAASVHRYLEQQGVNGERMYAAGFGPAKPRATKAKSRRVEIVVVLKQ